MNNFATSEAVDMGLSIGLMDGLTLFLAGCPTLCDFVFCKGWEILRCS